MRPCPLLLLLALIGLLACDNTRPVTLTDSAGPVRRDGGSVADQALADLALPAPDVGLDGVLVITDKQSYPAKQQLKGTVLNKTTDAIFLQGCSIFSWEKQVGSEWVDKGPTMMCGWEGYARKVIAGGNLAEDSYPHSVGTWRLAALYGVGCLENQPLSSAQCSAMATARSAPFTVGSTLERCIALQSDYATALIAARQCSGSATGQCTRKVLESLACNCSTYVQDDTQLKAIQQQFLALGCDTLSGLPVCPPVACPVIVGAGCANNKGVDYGPD